jgi:hypothetical protein
MTHTSAAPFAQAADRVPNGSSGAGEGSAGLIEVRPVAALRLKQ